MLAEPVKLAPIFAAINAAIDLASLTNCVGIVSSRPDIGENLPLPASSCAAVVTHILTGLNWGSPLRINLGAVV